jgi:hypothetical protein
MNNDPLVNAAGGKEVNVESISKGYKPFEITLYEEDNATFFQPIVDCFNHVNN